MAGPNFVAAYKSIQASLLGELESFARIDPARLTYLQKLMDYTCLGGKMIRGKIVAEVAQTMAPLSRNVPLADVASAAAACGWAVEFMQAQFLIEDDIMDSSITRRDNPCWYRLPGVGFSRGINDGLIVNSWMNRILQQNLSRHPEYVTILELFMDTQYYTTLGQFYDVTGTAIPTPESKPKKRFDLTQFTRENYRRIVQHKTTYYTIQLPLCLGLAATGTSSLVPLADIRELSRTMGEYFQSRDDFLDCFGDTKVIGKVGTDIQEGKCTWLATAFLENATTKEKSLFEKNYGFQDKKKVALIKKLYLDAKLQDQFKAYEDKAGIEVANHLEKFDCRPFAGEVKKVWELLYQRTK